jgi:hypothetical protein
MQQKRESIGLMYGTYTVDLEGYLFMYAELLMCLPYHAVLEFYNNLWGLGTSRNRVIRIVYCRLSFIQCTVFPLPPS